MTALMAVAALALVISIPWFIVAALAEIFPSLKPRARWHVRTSAKTGGIAFVALIVLAVASPTPPSDPEPVEPVEVAALEEPPSATEALESDDLGVSTGEIARPTPRPVLETDQVAEAEPTRPQPRQRDAIDNVSLLCRMLESSGELSAPCEYSGWHSTITISASMLPGQARELCGQISDLTRQMGMGLRQWTMHIKSPYSGDNSIAFCRLA